MAAAARPSGALVRFAGPLPEGTALDLDPSRWHSEFVGAPEREATGPNGQSATVTDNVIALRRLTR